MNFVFVSLQRINTDRESTSTCLAKELAKNHKVLYVNAPIDRRAVLASGNDSYITAHIEAIKNKEEPLTQADANLWVLNPARIIESINWVPFTAVFSALNRINNYRFGKDIQEALDTLGFKDFVLINDKDIFRSFYLKDILKPRHYIYLDRDYTIGTDYWRKHGVELEPRLMRKSDAVVCNSLGFTRRAQKYNANSFYIGNGVELEQFCNLATGSAPDDLAAIPQPIIGYVGAIISLRLNIRLMVEAARAKPQWSFVLVGPEDEAFRASELHQLPNVYFLGKKHTKEIPNYIKHFDVCVNPQVINDITISNFPLKTVEYLALGKPVVATATDTMKEIFSEYTYLAEDTSSYLAQLEQALLQDTEVLQQQRIAFAKTFSWESVTEILLNCIHKISRQHPVPA
ncbi:glycosyltransferase [Pontibacter beigongshangensis]|uniref:glycosyltransferase n=1 Tax=Pontibacter beigongshangensis TaxID=2574733 RepID=UPI00164F7C33|nr:glycosyltransferase [Pontibacter beigongshangensis]